MLREELRDNPDNEIRVYAVHINNNVRRANGKFKY